MGHPLEQRVEVVRREALRQLRREAVWKWLAVIVLVIATAILLDVVFRFQDYGLRVLVAACCWLAVGWFTGKLLWPSLWASIPPLEIALRLEHYFPILQHRLASAVEFLGQPLDDSLAGSAALRRGVVIDAQALSEGLDFGAVIDRRPARLAVIGFGIVAGIVAVAVAADLALHLPSGRPASSGIALRRLVLPLGDLEWPRQHYLAVRKPVTKIARGDDFEVEVVDRFQAKLPADVHVEFRSADGAVVSEPLQTLGEAALARRDQVEQSFAYRVLGGDDHTFPWTDVEVLAPPEVADLKVRVHPPAYLGWPAETSPPLVRAWRGTRVELSGQANTALNSATVCLEDGRRLPAVLDKDRRGFRLAADAPEALVVENSGAYWIELESTDGVRGGAETRYDIRALVDAPPRVTIAQPAGNMFVTPAAVVPMDVAVADDLAIHEIGLRVARSDQTESGMQTISLYQGAESSVAPRAGGVPTGEERQATHAWELAPLALPVGIQLQLVAFASDYSPQTGVSTERQLSIITPEELLDRLAERQTLILNELARLLRLQYESQAQVEGVQVGWKHEPKVQAGDLERLQAGELAQRQVTRGLTDVNDGVAAQVASVLADLEINRIDHPDSRRQLADIQATLQSLRDGPLRIVEREFTAGVKLAQRHLDEVATGAAAALNPELTAHVDALGAEQRRVIESLEALLARLTRWDALRRQLRELAQLREDLERLSAETLTIGRQTLARSLRDLAPQERAELERLSLAQHELARRLDNVLQALDRAASELASTDAAAAQSIQDALADARRASPSGVMRAAARGVAENQIGQATLSQEQAEESIDALIAALTNRQERELSRLVEKLRGAAETLRALETRQAVLREQMPGATPEGMQRLAEEQKSLAEATERAAREMERLQASAAAQLAESAASAMQGAARQASAGAAQEAAQSAEQAQQALAAAQEALENAAQQAEQQLAQQAMQQLQTALQQLSDRQQRVLTETERLEARRLEAGAWTRADLAEVRALSGAQAELSKTAAATAESLPAAPVLRKALDQAANAMQSAGARLADQDAGDKTQAVERQALARLAQLQAALKSEAAQPNDAQQNQQSSESPEGGQDQSDAPPEALQRLAELKMLKLLQVEVHERTQALEDQLRRHGNLATEERAQLDALSAEQVELAEMLSQLTSEPSPTEVEMADPPPEPSE